METKYDITDRFVLISKRFPSILDLVVGLFLFLSTFFVYLTHLAPSIVTGDSADATIASYVLGIPHPPGFPVYTWFGHIFTFIPLGDIAYRVNLMSAFFGALTIPVVYMIIRSLAPRSQGGFADIASLFGSIIGSMSFAFCICYWTQAEVAEVYTLNSFFIASMLLLVLVWTKKRDARLLYLFSLFYGLSTGVNAANILFGPSFLVLLLFVDRDALLNRRTLLSMIFIFCAVGAVQLLYLFIRAWQVPLYSYADIRNLDAFLDFITASEYSGLPFSIPLLSGMRRYVVFLAESFSLIGISIGTIGIALSLKRDLLKAAFLASFFLVNVLFFVQFNSIDIYDKLIPSFMIFSIFIGLGVFEVLGLIISSAKGVAISQGGKRGLLLRAFLIILMLIIAASVPISSYSSYSQEMDRSASIDTAYFLAKALNELPANSTIIDIWQTCMPLKYFQIIYHINPSVEIMCADPLDWTVHIQKRIKGKNIFLFRTELVDESIADRYSVTPVLAMPGIGVLHKIAPKYSSYSEVNPAIQHPMDELLGGKIRLLGYNLSQTEEKDRFSLTYYWQSTGNVSKDYICAFDLIDGNGNVALEFIHIPVQGNYPSSRWEKNELLAERYNLSLPPTIKPGNYKMFITGTWDKDDSAGYDHVLLGEIEVEKIDLKDILVNYRSNT